MEERQRNEARIRRERNETWRPKKFIPAGDTWVFTDPLEQRLKAHQRSLKEAKAPLPATKPDPVSSKEENNGSVGRPQGTAPATSNNP